MTILAATDFSPRSQTAVQLAAAFARDRRSRLTLVHAIESALVDVSAAPVTAGWENALASAAEAAIAAEAVELRKTGVTVDTRLAFGTIPRGILEAAGDVSADLIVMGTGGRRSAARLFCGGRAEAVVRRATCPVLIAGTDPDRLTGWRGGFPCHLAIATDGSSASEAAYSWVRRSPHVAGAEMSFVRLCSSSRDLSDHVRTANVSQEPSIALVEVSRDVGKDIAYHVRDLGADAIVIGIPTPRQFASSRMILASLLRSMSVPVFCVPEAWQPWAPAPPEDPGRIAS